MVGAVLSLFLLVTKRLYGKEWEWSIGQIKTCRKKQHVKIDDIKEMSDLICGKAAVGGNYNSTRDNKGSTFFAGNQLSISWISYNFKLIILKLMHFAGIPRTDSMDVELSYPRS